MRGWGMGGHHGWFGKGGRRAGASFKFHDSDGSSFSIRCSARDTTQECVDAIMPLIDRFMPDDESDRSGARGAEDDSQMRDNSSPDDNSTDE